MIHLIRAARAARQLLIADSADVFSAAINRAQLHSPSTLGQGSATSTPVFQQPLGPPTPGSGMGFGVYSPDYLETMQFSNFALEDEPNLPLYAYHTPTDGSESLLEVEPVDNAQEPDELSPEEKEEIAAEATEGKSLDLLAEEHGLSRQEVLDLLEDDGWEVETTEQPSGVVIEEITDEDGETTTTVVDEEGNRTTLEPGQETTREGIEGIVDGVADGQSIDEIAESQGLTRGQVIAQLEAAGFELESDVTGQGPSYVNTIEITDKESGESLVHQETKPDGTTTSRRTDADGNEISHTVHPDGSTTRVVTEPDGRETETRVDADGKTTETVTYEQNGVTVEEVTDDDGETTTTIIDEDGSRTKLDPDQETTREGIDEIAEAVANGKSIDEIAEDQGLTREQVMAQLRAAGYVVESETNELANGGEQYTTRIVDAEDGEEVIASYSNGRGTGNSSLYIDAEGNETRRTEHTDGSTTETVTKADGRETKTIVDADGETTTEVTDNGYTLITPPDGDMTLRRNEDGTEIKVAEGTPLAALVDTLLEVDPNSSDAGEARSAEVVQAAVESVLAGERVEDLQSDIDDKANELEDYGSGHQPDSNVTYENPYGDPPTEEPPSGGTWVPMNGVWMDSKVAEATIDLNALLAEQLEADAEFMRSQAQMDVFALDSDYDGAIDRAGEILDNALAPHGMVWVRPDKPKGNLADARERLTSAESRLEDAGEASSEYQQAQGLLDDAITAQDNMPEFSSFGVCTGEESSAELQLMEDQFEREQSEYDAAQANVDALFYEMGLHNSKGDNLLADYMVSMREQQLADAEPGTEEHTALETALEEAETLQDNTGNQLEAAQAYYDFYAAKRDTADLESDAYDIRDDLLEAFNADKGLNEEGKEFYRVSGDYLGEFTGEQVIEEREDGLWVTTHFEHGTTEERLAPDEMSEWWEENRDPDVTSRWLEYGDDRQTAHEQEANAGEALHRTLEDNFGITQQDLATEISDLEEELNGLFEQHGRGTADAPEAAFPEGVEPQEISIGDHDIQVTPQVAEDYAEHGLDALTASGQPVGVEIDGETRWVHPEVALTSIALEVARDRQEEQRTALESAQESAQQAADRYELLADQPAQRLGESDADYAARVEYGYLEDDSEQALDALYQPRFQELFEQGFNNEFMTHSDNGLERMVEETLGLNRSTEEKSEAFDEVLESIHDIGGNNPETTTVPLFHVNQEAGVSQVNLIAVKGDDGEIRYVDATGQHYSDLEDFQDHNEMFSEDGKLIVPKGLEMSLSEDGTIPLEVVDASHVSVQDKIIDPLVGIGTGIATVLSFTPAAPVAAPLAYLGGGYLGYRAIEHQYDHISHGGDWSDSESWLNSLSVATTFLPAGSSLLRTVGMARSPLVNMTKGQAFLASIGAVKPGSAMATSVTAYMQTGSTLNRSARLLDWGAIGTGVPLMVTSALSLALNGNQMSGLQRADAIVGLGTGFAGTGLGAHGLVTTRPSRAPKIQLHDEGGNPVEARVLGGRPPESVENIYVQPEIGPRPRGDEAGVMNKTHIFHRDPKSGEAYVMPWIRGASEPSRPQSDDRPSSRIEALRGRDSADGSVASQFIYRLDSRDPETIFQEGFLPRFGAWSNKYSDLKEAVTAHLWAEDSVFVSTSRELQMAKGAGEESEWIYVIVDPETGIVVDNLLGSHDWEGASEVVYDAIPSEYIVGARQLGENKELRPRSKQDGVTSDPTWANVFTDGFVRNPNFDPSLWPNSRIDSERRTTLHDQGPTADRVIRQTDDQEAIGPFGPDTTPGRTAVNKSSPDYRPEALRARLPRAIEEAYSPTPDHDEPTVIFRGDTRTPEDIFSNGFNEEGQPFPSGVISTSLSAREAKGFAKGADEEGNLDGTGGWLYTIIEDVSDGDIVYSLPVQGRFPSDRDHYEVPFSGEVPPEDILAARQVDFDGRLFGPVVYNPNFKDPARLPGEIGRDGGDGSPRSLSAAYHPEGTPFPESPSNIPAAFRKPGQPRPSEVGDFPRIGEFSTALDQYPSLATREALAGMDLASLRAGLESQGIDPSTARAFAADIDRIANTNPLSEWQPSRQEIAVASTDSGALGRLTTAEFAEMSNDLLRRIPITHMGRVKLKHLNALSRDQIGAFSPEQIGGLDPKVVRALGDKFTWLTTEQLGGLTKDQMGEVSAWQLSLLSDEQLGAFSVSQKRALHEKVQQLLEAAYPQTYETLTSGLFTSLANEAADVANITALPWRGTRGQRYWANSLLTLAAFAMPLSSNPIANSIAFGTRGLSMSSRAITAHLKNDPLIAEKPLGRILRGIEFVTLAVNTPNLVQGVANFESPVANGTFTAGNGLFAIKLFTEASLGRTIEGTGDPRLLREGDDWGLILFAVGSVDHMRSTFPGLQTGNMGDIASFISGALFGTSSIALWSATPMWMNIKQKLSTNAPLLRPVIRRLPESSAGQVQKVQSETSQSVQQETTSASKLKTTLLLVGGFGGGLMISSVLASQEEQGSGEPSEEEKETSPPPQRPSEPSEPPPSPGEPPTLLVVLARDGLNLRNGPTAEAPIVTTFRHGTFLEEMGQRRKDEDGNEWVHVSGPGPDGSEQQGWVMAHHVDEHAEGAMGDNGRINPELEVQGYESVDVQPGQTLGGIAVHRGHDVGEVVMLNLDHIIDPSTLFPGDRVYLPRVATQASSRNQEHATA